MEGRAQHGGGGRTQDWGGGQGPTQKYINRRPWTGIARTVSVIRDGYSSGNECHDNDNECLVCAVERLNFVLPYAGLDSEPLTCLLLYSYLGLDLSGSPVRKKNCNF